MSTWKDNPQRPRRIRTVVQVVGSPWFWLTLALLAAIGIESPLRRSRLERLARTSAVTGEQPVWVQYVMVGLGGFRGVIAEALWMRAARLQEQGRYFEQVQLADWITTLDPRSSDAWVFNSWNLAYNISAMMPRFEDRLTWLDAGIALLRDRAIPINPTDARLYRELGWLYQNKIGDATDPAHRLYKLALVESFSPLITPLGGAPLVDSDAAQRLQRDFRLDCSRMVALESHFGKLDWRLPQSHAIYWAWSGLPVASGFEHQALRRMIHQNLLVLIENGRFTGDLAERQFTTAPNPNLIPATTAFFEETVRLYANETKVFARYLSFAIRLQSQSGDHAGARQSYLRLRELAGNRHHVPEFETLANQTQLDETFFAPTDPGHQSP